ncbi:hypothetical protein FCV25MIE_34264, partial [Fagus crenata]
MLYMSKVDLHGADEIQDRLRLTFPNYFTALMRSKIGSPRRVVEAAVFLGE